MTMIDNIASGAIGFIIGKSKRPKAVQDTVTVYKYLSRFVEERLKKVILSKDQYSQLHISVFLLLPLLAFEKTFIDNGRYTKKQKRFFVKRALDHFQCNVLGLTYFSNLTMMHTKLECAQFSFDNIISNVHMTSSYAGNGWLWNAHIPDEMTEELELLLPVRNSVRNAKNIDFHLDIFQQRISELTDLKPDMENSTTYVEDVISMVYQSALGSCLSSSGFAGSVLDKIDSVHLLSDLNLTSGAYIYTRRKPEYTKFKDFKLAVWTDLEIE